MTEGAANREDVNKGIVGPKLQAVIPIQFGTNVIFRDCNFSYGPRLRA